MRNLLMYIHRILFLCRKELLAVLKEPSSRVILFVPALLQSLLFGYAASFDLKNVQYAVLDQSKGYLSTELLAHLDGTGSFQRVATLISSTQIAEQIDSGDALMVLVIPTDFESQIAQGKPAPVQVILDGRNSSTASSALGYVNNIVSSLNQKLGASSSIQLTSRAWYNPNSDSRWNILPALIATLSLLQTLMISALSVAREREMGTFDQLLVTPLTPTQILIGKAVPSIAIGLIQSSIVLLIVRFWFQVPMNGSLGLLYCGLVMFTIAAVGIGLSISALSVSMQQAMLFTFLSIMPLILLSGMLTPVGNMPEVLQIATYINPLRFGINLVRRVYLEGAGFEQVYIDFIPLLIIAVITLPLASWLFRNRLT